MAHANIFQKLNKNTPKESSMEDTTIETIKILGEQVIFLREMIEEQHLVIEDLAKTVSSLSTRQKEAEQNINLAYIDQKDLAKQMRILKSNQQANQYVQKKEQFTVAEKNDQQRNDQQNQDSEIEELFFNNAKNSTVMKNSAASDAIKKTLAELKKLEEPKKRFLAKKASEAQQAQVNSATTRQEQTQTPANRSMSDSELSKRIIFGKTPKFMR